ncbi:Lantibiotic modifying enzyme [Chryseobacterium nakagawai]|uniref:Type 2 lantipeptide synthetase LanM n=1 Tax=Chryseobacterium nakagawai TaxID=1241982 RepID=A0AAD1DR10_CHRNA|nr:type 2 lanthipeptide synthetase LanM [Chryseobacterium nakagawai]AZA90965.1 type 2 lantipeptide synthetase LanM [Chryseobacterium nakagawai]VEH22509.1 Lantibiotic modifying enzyme [Chryseobacterium nakagawai]
MFRFSLKNTAVPHHVTPDFYYCNYDINSYVESSLACLISQYNLDYSSEILDSISSQIILSLKNGLLSLTMVHEFEIANRAELLNEDSLLEDFIILTNTFEWKEYFLEKYPDIEDKITAIIDKRLEYCVFFLHKLKEDYLEINDSFQINITPDMMIGLELFKGDIHRGGKFVISVTFEEGSILYFKPRDSYNELFFSHVLSLIREKGEELNIEIPSIITRDDYSWMSHLEYGNNFETKAEVEKFYESLGKTLCVFHALGTSDIIPDNLIITNNRIGFFDLECIISKPLLKNYDTVTGIFKESVIKTDALTGLLMIDGEYNSYLVSSIFFRLSNQETTFSNWDKESLTFEKKEGRAFTGTDTHVPRINNEYVDFNDTYYECVKKGFQEMYLFFVDNKDYFIEKLGELPKKLRVILHATSVYTQLLRESIVPENLIDNTEFLEILDSFIQITYVDGMLVAPHTLKASIARQFDTNDIPFFYFNTENGGLYDGNDDVLCEDWQFDIVNYNKNRFASLNEDKLKIQLEILDLTTNYAFDLLGKECDIRKKQILQKEIPFEISVDGIKKTNEVHTKARAAAIKIADEILERKILHHGKINWISKVRENNNKYNISLLNYDLYDGVSGMCFVYLHLYDITSEAKYKWAAESIFDELSDILLRRHHDKYYPNLSPEILENTPVSPYYYPASLLYLLFQNSVLHTEKNIGLIPIMLSELSFILGSTRQNDFLLGTLGLLSMLLDLKKDFPVQYEEQLKSLIDKCIEKLEREAKRTENKLLWESIDNDVVKDFGGFAHGSSSAALVISKVKALHKDIDIEVDEILNHDRSFYDKEIEGWIDNREDILSSRDSAAWCHGSAGIGLGRLLLSEYYRDEIIENEIAIARENIIKHGIGYNQCICHGDLGNLEVLYAMALQAKDEIQQAKILAYIDKVAEKILEGSILREGNEGTTEVLGLFTGVIGQVFQLLRFSEWDKVPSILCLELPNNLNKILHE